MKLFFLIGLIAFSSSGPDAPIHEAEQIFPPLEMQTHAAGIVECPNGDLIASWYCDTRPGDSAILGAEEITGPRHGVRLLRWRIDQTFRTAIRR